MEILTNEDILTLVGAGTNVSVIGAKIKASRTDFDTSVSALLDLQKASVDDSVRMAMI